MSDLSKPAEAASWISSWTDAVADHRCSPERWFCKLTESVNYFAAQVAQCEAEGRWPSCWNPADVRASLKLLRVALAKARGVDRHPRTERYELRDGFSLCIRGDFALVADELEVDLGTGFQRAGIWVGHLPRGHGTARAALEAVLSRFFFLPTFEAKTQAGWALLTDFVSGYEAA